MQEEDVDQVFLNESTHYIKMYIYSIQHHEDLRSYNLCKIPDRTHE